MKQLYSTKPEKKLPKKKYKLIGFNWRMARTTNANRQTDKFAEMKQKNDSNNGTRFFSEGDQSASLVSLNLVCCADLTGVCVLLMVIVRGICETAHG